MSFFDSLKQDENNRADFDLYVNFDFRVDSDLCADFEFCIDSVF